MCGRSIALLLLTGKVRVHGVEFGMTPKCVGSNLPPTRPTAKTSLKTGRTFVNAYEPGELDSGHDLRSSHPGFDLRRSKEQTNRAEATLKAIKHLVEEAQHTHRLTIPVESIRIVLEES